MNDFQEKCKRKTMNDNKIKIGALWKKQGKKGEYFTGTFGDANLVIFSNNYKNSEKSPDYIVYITPKEKKPVDPQNAHNEFFQNNNDEIPF